MNCKELERLVVEDIRTVNDVEVQDHIGRCDKCEKLCREFLSMEGLSSRLRDQVEAPDDFSARVCERLTQGAGWWVFRRPVVALCVVLGAAVLVLWATEVQVGSSAEKTVLNSRQIVEESEFLPRAFVNEPGLRDANHVRDPYVDVILRAPAEPEYILRLPSRIEIHRTDLHHDFYLNHVSY